ncbi:MAG: prepilin peptidase [Dehalococcoidia bacterium]|nr:prepilin peptidase [Dehalococcoidia bacterium]
MTAAAVSLALALRPDFYEAGPALLTAACLLVLVALSSTDFDRRRIPNTLTYPAFAVALALCWAWPDRTVGEMLLGAGVVAAMALVGFGVLLGGGGLDWELATGN